MDPTAAATEPKTKQPPAQEPMPCPEGMHRDEKGECVPNPPTAMEEAVKALQDQMTDLRVLVMRVLQEGISGKAAEKAVPAPTVQPESDIDRRFRALAEEQAKTWKAEYNKMFNEFVDQQKAVWIEVQAKMRQPGAGPKGQMDRRSAGPVTQSTVLTKFYEGAGKGGVK